MKTNNFDKFLGQISFEDEDEKYQLFHAIKYRCTYGAFSYRIEGEVAFVSQNGIDVTLKIASEKAGAAFLSEIERRFGGEYGLEDEYAYRQALQKED